MKLVIGVFALLLTTHYVECASPIQAPPPRVTYPYYVSASVPELHGDLYNKVFNTILSQIFYNSNRTQSPFEFKTPEELRKLIDFSLPETRVSHTELENLVEKIFKYSPRSSHPFRVDRHSAGLDPQGLLGDWMATAMTVPMVTYKESPVFTLMENALTERIRQLIGYPGGQGDGIITAGSSTGNSYAIQIALQDKFPNWRNSGIVGGGVPSVAIFLSEDALFSYEKYCIWEGIGMSACIRVPTDTDGRMSVSDLTKQMQQAKSQGRVPVMVIATAGTPVLGAIDPIQDIGRIAKDNNMWFHVDGQSGGSYFLSEQLQDKLTGLSSADSFLWSPEKALSLPAVSAVLVSKKENIFTNSFSLGAEVLFKNTSLYNASKWDNGDKTMQATRRPSIAKLWFAVKSKGQEKLAKHLDYTHYLKIWTVAFLRTKRCAFTLVTPYGLDSNQVAFYYIHPNLRLLSKSTLEQVLLTTRFTERLKATLLKEGALSISVDTWRQQKNPFFVMSLRNSVVSKDDIRYMLDIIEYYGERTSLLLRSGELSNQSATVDFSEIGEKVLPIPLPIGPKPKVPAALSSYPDFVNSPVEDIHRQQLQDFVKEDLKIGTYYEDKRSEPSLLFNTPEDLLTKFDFSLTNPTGITSAADLTLFRELVKYSAHNGHPYFDFHLAEALDAYGSMADYVLTALNSALVTYEDNPVLTLMEEELIKAIIKLVGFPGGVGTGLILPGGSASDQIALLLATRKKFPETKEAGLSKPNKTLVAFLSRGAHYATNKGAFFSGIGLDNAVSVKTDARGRMDPKDLEAKILVARNDGKVPFYVVATFGTTVLGAIDPIKEIADVAEKYGLWLHVDGTYGGSTLFSNNEQTKRARFTGIERADSFTFNAHKALAASRMITCFVTKHQNILDEVAPPPSLQEFNNKVLYDGLKYDGGIKHLFPERRGSVLKLWFMWKAKGRQGLGEHIDYGFDLTAKTNDYLLSMNNTFALVNPEYPPELLNVNFYYLPPRYRGAKLTETLLSELAKIQVQIDDTVIRENALYVSVEGYRCGIPNALILSLYNSALTFEDVKYMLQVIDYYGKNM